MFLGSKSTLALSSNMLITLISLHMQLNLNKWVHPGTNLRAILIVQDVLVHCKETEDHKGRDIWTLNS